MRPAKDVLIYDRYWLPGDSPAPDLPAEGFREAAPANREPSLIDTQSIGAAIENMTLGDVWYAIDRLNAFVGRRQGLTAALSVGYPDESPAARPRRHRTELTEWLA